MLYDFSSVYAQMEHSVDFIRSLLSSAPDQDLRIESEERDTILEIESDPDKLDFVPIEDKKSAFKTCAVDGGQGTIVRNSVYTAGVYRAGYVIFEGINRIADYCSDLSMVNLDQGSFAEIYREAYSSTFKYNPEDCPEFSNSLSALRGLREYEVTMSALEKLNPGDLLLADGALQHEDKINAMIFAGAQAAQINLAGVVKSSALLWQGGANLVGVINKLGDEQYRHKTWFVKIGSALSKAGRKHLSDIYVAKLNGYCDLSFRVDLNINNPEPPSEVFSKLAELALDPYFLGYPYPLASVHQMVRLTAEELDHFAGRLKDITLASGVQENEWDILFGDYHNILNHGLRDRMVRY